MIEFDRHRVPGPLWVAIVSLGLVVLAKVAAALRLGPMVLIDAAVSGLLLMGIVLGHRWAYVLTIVFGLLGTLVGMKLGLRHGLMMLALNSLVLIPVLLCTRYYFPAEPGEPEDE